LIGIIDWPITFFLKIKIWTAPKYIGILKSPAFGGVYISTRVEFLTKVCDKAIHYWEHNGGTCLELGEDFGKQARI
jgi:drug/metabolite transporter superfamily protein YnfA